MKAPKLLYRNSSGAGKPFELVFHHVRRPKVDAHSHDFEELFWMKEGRCRHVWNGEAEELSVDDFVAIAPADVHSFETLDENGFKVVNLAFPAGALRALARRYALPDGSIWRSGGSKPRRLRLKRGDGAWLDEEFKRLRERPQSRLSLDGFLIALTLRFGEGGADPLPTLPEWLREAMSEMSRRENFSQGPRRLAELSGRSLAHISRILKRESGRGPSQWVSDLRMAYAQERLELGSEPVDQIAYECGFAAKSRFHSLFAARFKTSPLRYRKMRRSAFPARDEFKGACRRRES